MGLSELLGGFAGENGEKHPLMHAFPQVRNIRHEKVPRKPLRSSGIMSNLGPFFCKRAQKMGRRGTDIANNKLRAPEMGHRTKRERVLRLCGTADPPGSRLRTAAAPQTRLPPASAAERCVRPKEPSRDPTGSSQTRTGRLSSGSAQGGIAKQPEGQEATQSAVRSPRHRQPPTCQAASPADQRPGVLRDRPIAPRRPCCPPARPPCLLAAITCFLVCQ